MTETNIDFSTIEHLDFDPHQDNSEKCQGWETPNDKSHTDCSNPAKVYAVRSCCGKINTYCLKCYNDICEIHAKFGGKSSHTLDEVNWHPVTGSPFSSVEFIK